MSPRLVPLAKKPSRSGNKNGRSGFDADRLRAELDRDFGAFASKISGFGGGLVERTRVFLQDLDELDAPGTGQDFNLMPGDHENVARKPQGQECKMTA
ncbi:hypothetical protein [Rhizobium sp. SSA_523]|uniref:hypothetical protein n=1 Tax=Rhizobium sp. SSA_523 TaxID=2952477 RepID=UPI0020906901|nr:hypothetical protein [Rhizobium sp. SSA_523]MCO5731724.1 hypothetical protein [Rhizobium sp. SSA_523]WKC22903.1 hypothetical protein QTJ18_18915 [Rhizobium sp. SSA_523]